MGYFREVAKDDKKHGNISLIEESAQTVVTYTYDELDRVEEVKYYNNRTNETVRYGYRYSSGGSLSGITKNGVFLYIYDYDTLGRLIHSSVSSGTLISMYLKAYNALKYRGYYYDADLGLYYLNSRFYDPIIGRFINADTTDVLTVNPTSLTDKNLYAYGDNNPVMRKDQKGKFGVTVGKIAIALVTQYAGEQYKKIFRNNTTTNT